MWNYGARSVGIAVMMSFINGLISVILTVGTLPLLETAFSITTEIRLMELSNLNHPLLKKLMIEAPGTYNHSIWWVIWRRPPRPNWRQRPAGGPV